MRKPLLMLSTALLALASCEDAGPRMGAVEVRVEESGIDTGFSAFIVHDDLEGAFALGPDRSVVFVAKSGRHSVTLAGVAGNCTVQGGDSRSVDIPANDTVLVTFASTCVERAGDILVQTMTAGSDVPAEFQMLVDSGAAGSEIGIATLPNDSKRLAGLKEGTHAVTLRIPDNCATSPTTQQVFVRHASTSSISFFTACARIKGALRLTVATSGTDIDVDGYALELTSDGYRRTVSLPSNGTLVVDSLPNGAYQLKPAGAARNCAFAAAQTAATVLRRDTVSVTIGASCTPATKLRITASATGSDVDPKYSLVLQRPGAAAETFDVASNGITVLSPLDSGTTQLTLNQVAFNCDAAVPPATLRLPSQQTTDLSLTTTCNKASTIAFMYDRNIYLLRTNEDSAKLLAGSVGQPSWSPDGKRIAARSYGGGNEDIMVISLAVPTVPLRLTYDQRRDNNPAWSPDGSRIMFVSERRGRQEIFTMDTTGADVRLFAGDDANYRDPAWHSDGRVVMVRDSADEAAIYVVAAGTAGKTRVGPPGGGRSGPVLSPDGTRIAYSTYVDCANDNLNYCSRIMLANADGSAAVELSSTAAWDTGPAWSPDGNWIVFARSACVECQNGLVAVRLDRQRTRVLVPWDLAADPAWKP